MRSIDDEEFTVCTECLCEIIHSANGHYCPDCSIIDCATLQLTDAQITARETIMTKSTHTPGPWVIIKRNHKSILGNAFRVEREAGSPTIAIVRFSDNPAMNEEIGLANAHLIAAAPDLLEALQVSLDAMAEFRYFLDSPHPWSEIKDNQDKAYAVIIETIATARGES